jgi:23S rRNA pseudouridine1911/1915/1917 synthase
MAESGKYVMVPPEFEGKRLDQGLGLLAPGLGLRGRKRLWETHRVLVDGHTLPKGARLRAGQVLCLEPLEGAAGGFSSVREVPDLPAVVWETAEFAALLKPAGLHTERIAGRSGPCLADSLAELWPDRPARLLNRLDRLTSGLVMVGLSAAAPAAYQAFEDQGLIRKRYLAVVAGHPCRTNELTVVRRGLDTAGRRKTRVLEEDNPDRLRWTEVRTLRDYSDKGPDTGSDWGQGKDAALVLATIRKGARHQIRAHLASLGHPILGDPLYGSLPGPLPEQSRQESPLFLHHFRIEFPGFSALAWPDWANRTDRLLAEEATAVAS